MAHSNWNLFYDRVDKCVKSVATNHARKQGAKESVYGSVNYFLRMLEWQLERKATSLNELTPIGLIIRDKWIHYKRSEEHTSELQSRGHLVCRLLLEKKKKRQYIK